MNEEAYVWQLVYLDALSEKDQSLLPARVTKAREAIINRRVSLHKGRADDKEIEALEIALKTLRILYSNWV
jgi:hypothetical protein